MLMGGRVGGVLLFGARESACPANRPTEREDCWLHVEPAANGGSRRPQGGLPLVAAPSDVSFSQDHVGYYTIREKSIGRVGSVRLVEAANPWLQPVCVVCTVNPDFSECSSSRHLIPGLL